MFVVGQRARTRRLTHAAVGRHHQRIKTRLACELRSRHLIHRLPIAQMVGADVVSSEKRIAAVMPADAPHLGMRQTAQHREMLAVRLQRLEILGKLKVASFALRKPVPLRPLGLVAHLDGHAKGKIYRCQSTGHRHRFGGRHAVQGRQRQRRTSATQKGPAVQPPGLGRNIAHD